MNKTSTKKRGFVTGLLAMVLAIMMAVPMLLNSDSFAAPKAPGKVSLTSISAPAYNKIKINWKKVSGATHYKIYYRKAGTRKWNGVKTVSSKYSSYTHVSNKSDPIVVGQKYNYTVKAYNSKTKKSGKYNTKGLTAKTIPATVKLNNVSLNSDGTVKVTWNKAAGANKYVIFCRNQDNTEWLRVDTVDGNTFSYTVKYPYEGQDNIYTVKSYYSKTDTYGKYNTKGLSVYVPYPDGWEEPEPEEPPIDPTDIAGIQRDVLKYTNEVRAKYNSPPLKPNDALNRAAMIRAKELSISFSHTRPNGTDSSTVGKETGAGYICGENIGVGYHSPKDVVFNGWEESSLHCIQLIDVHNRYLGVGFYKAPNGTQYWVQLFAGGNPDEKATITFDTKGGRFDTLGGVSTYSVQTPMGQAVYMKDIPVPVKEGYIFDGWVDKYGMKLNYRAVTCTMYATWKPV